MRLLHGASDWAPPPPLLLQGRFSANSVLDGSHKITLEVRIGGMMVGRGTLMAWLFS